jgi:23S rRNA (adenine2503-C2)-methyltransferase
MPINRKWNIEAVMDAVRQVKLRPGSGSPSSTFCWRRDRPAGACPRGCAPGAPDRLPAKVNLIAWNPGPGIPYSMPQPGAVEAFKATLAGEGIPAYLRRPRGRDIYAACGQLKRTRGGCQYGISGGTVTETSNAWAMRK